MTVSAPWTFEHSAAALAEFLEFQEAASSEGRELPEVECPSCHLYHNRHLPSCPVCHPAPIRP